MKKILLYKIAGALVGGSLLVGGSVMATNNVVATANEENVIDLIRQAKEDVKSEITEEYNKTIESVKAEFDSKLAEKENEINSLKSQIETLSNAQSKVNAPSNEEINDKIEQAKEEVKEQINAGDKKVESEITHENIEKDRKAKQKEFVIPPVGDYTPPADAIKPEN